MPKLSLPVAGDVAALAQQIVRVTGDEMLRHELAQRGRQRSLDFAWPRVTDAIEALYRDVLARRAAVPSAA